MLRLAVTDGPDTGSPPCSRGVRGPRRRGPGHRHRRAGRVRAPLPRCRPAGSAGADVVVSAEPELPSGPATCRSRCRSAARSRPSWSSELAQLPGVTAAVGDIELPRRRSSTPDGQVVPTGGPADGRARLVLDEAAVVGRAGRRHRHRPAPARSPWTAPRPPPRASRPGDRVRSSPPAAPPPPTASRRWSTRPDAGISSPTRRPYEAVRPRRRERAGTVDLIALRTEPGAEAAVAAAAREKITARHDDASAPPPI